jgi:hypothetical protein
LGRTTAILLELIFPGLTGKMAFSWIADGQNGGADKARVHCQGVGHSPGFRICICERALRFFSVVFRMGLFDAAALSLYFFKKPEA